MVLNTINVLKRACILWGERQRVHNLGLSYRLIGFYPKRKSVLVWSNSSASYTLLDGRTSGFNGDYFFCETCNHYENVILRKNQIVIVGNDLIIKQLFSGASSVGLKAEKKQREKLRSRGFKIAPLLFEIDIDKGLLSEEYIKGKPLFSGHINGKEIVEIGVSTHKELIRAGAVRSLPLTVLYSLYQKKLNRMMARFKDKRVSYFVNSKLSDLISFTRMQEAKQLIQFTDIVHGDFNPRNNLIIDKDGKVRIIDWEHSASGPLYFDIFYMLVHMRLEVAQTIKYLKQTSLDVLGHNEPVGAHIRMCFLLLVIIKLNLWEGKDELRRKALTKRLAMLEHVYSIVKRNF